MLTSVTTPWGIRRYFKYIMRILVVSFILFFVIFPSYGQFTSVEELTKYIPSKTVKQVHTDLTALALDVKTDKPISIKLTVVEYTDNSYSVFFVAKKVENQWVKVKSPFVPVSQGIDRLRTIIQDKHKANSLVLDFELRLLQKNNPFTSLEERGYQFVSVESKTDIIAVKDLRFENGKIETELVQPYVKPKKNHAFWQLFKINDSNIWEWFKMGFYCIIGLFGLAALIIVLVKLLKKLSRL